jgi:hypothetical protein
LGPVMDHQSSYGGQGGVPSPMGRNGHQSTDANGKAVYRNRQEELRDPDFHRPARWDWGSQTVPASLLLAIEGGG